MNDDKRRPSSDTDPDAHVPASARLLGSGGARGLAKRTDSSTSARTDTRADADKVQAPGPESRRMPDAGLETRLVPKVDDAAVSIDEDARKIIGGLLDFA